VHGGICGRVVARCTCNGKCETLAARVDERRLIQEVSTRMVRLQQEVNQIKPTTPKKNNRPRNERRLLKSHKGRKCIEVRVEKPV